MTGCASDYCRDGFVQEAERDLENQRQQKQAHTAAKKQGLEAAWAD